MNLILIIFFIINIVTIKLNFEFLVIIGSILDIHKTLIKRLINIFKEKLGKINRLIK
jgi:hypothetical protein